VTRSPFKFLDAYGKEDATSFFGRERETALLYNAVHASNLVLVYGASGTGKTSIIDCGLANKFLDTDWLPLHVRRGTNVNASLDRALADASSGAAGGDVAVTERIRALYLEKYRPLYLIFDQFEELFILGERDERRRFYDTVRDVLASDSAPCKVIISLREEYIAYLSELERVVPTLFDNRVRVEKMSDARVTRVIAGTVRAAGVRVVDAKATVPAILENVRDPRTGVDLASLQVYLDRMWRADVERRGAQTPDAATFDVPLTERVGKLANVISAFLDEQLGAIEGGLRARGVAQPQGIPLEVLFALVTEEGTKRNLDVPGILEALPQNRAITEPDVRYVLDELQRLRLVRALAA
jgi:hypothetical protein